MRAMIVSMATEINQREFQNSSGEVMRRVEQGETFIVTRNGVPLAQLTPLSPERPRFVRREDAVRAAGELPAIDPERFRADLDAVVDPTVTLA